MKSKIVKVGYGKVKKVEVGFNKKLTFIGGPCAIESLDHSLFMADKIKKICKNLDIQFIFKSCFNKDSRSSVKSFNGIGIDEGLEILSKVRDKIGIPVISDFSELYLIALIRFVSRTLILSSISFSFRCSSL